MTVIQKKVRWEGEARIKETEGKATIAENCMLFSLFSLLPSRVTFLLDFPLNSQHNQKALILSLMSSYLF